jgi:hypothetical protein
MVHIMRQEPVAQVVVVPYMVMVLMDHMALVLLVRVITEDLLTMAHIAVVVVEPVLQVTQIKQQETAVLDINGLMTYGMAVVAHQDHHTVTLSVVLEAVVTLLLMHKTAPAVAVVAIGGIPVIMVGQAAQV